MKENREPPWILASVALACWACGSPPSPPAPPQPVLSSSAPPPAASAPAASSTPPAPPAASANPPRLEEVCLAEFRTPRRTLEGGEHQRALPDYLALLRECGALPSLRSRAGNQIIELIYLAEKAPDQQMQSLLDTAVQMGAVHPTVYPILFKPSAQDSALARRVSRDSRWKNVGSDVCHLRMDDPKEPVSLKCTQRLACGRACQRKMIIALFSPTPEGWKIDKVEDTSNEDGSCGHCQ